MRLYITDEESLIKYDLPNEIQESILIPYKPNNLKKEYTINIESSEGNWLLKSNGLVNIIQNNVIQLESKLTNYCTYELEIVSDKSKKILYCLPKIEKNTMKVSIFNINTFSIGGNPSNNIYYQNLNMINQHILIEYKDNKFLLTANGTQVFVNGIITRQRYLKIGDIIFVNGLKIIFMYNSLNLNNPNNSLIINGLQSCENDLEVNYTDYEKINSDEIDYDLYDNSQYFYHIPRILNGYGEETVDIDSPSEEQKEQHTPLILALGSSLTMAASSFMMGFSVVTGLSSGTRKLIDVLPQLVMCIAMIFGSIVMPKISTMYSNKLARKKEKYRKEKYTKYLQEKEIEIKKILEKQSQILKLNYPNQKECFNLIINKDKKLWERQINDKDFLSLSVGNGDIPANLKINAPQKKFTLDEDELQEQAYELVKKSRNLLDVPISYSLIERRFSAIICNSKIKKLYIDYLILQLVTMHSASDLKLAFFVNDLKQYSFAKYLPHTWSEDKKNRYFANKISDIKLISELLEKEIKERKEKLNPNKNSNDKKIEKNTFKSFSTYYLIIIDSYKRVKDIPIITKILSSEGNIGFSILFIEDTIVDLPPQCETFTYLLDNGSYIIQPGDEYSFTQKIKNPELLNYDMNFISSKLLNIPIPTKEGVAVLPKSLTFLEMYNVSKIEQLNILNRWKTNNPVSNLKTPIGVHADRELFMLDLHEKAHGPHGLIAGSTGSGKSEFIITFVLSMAINFHPNEVQFVLIDYKGGGLAGAFENREKGICLPHLAGTITNLDTAEMNRTLVSINSELKRRQAKFNTERDRLGEGTIDIYKYQKLYREGKIKEPIAHLFLIADEFAELKSQQPEFMDELISTARIGRSLGVHLILATQKPSGVVNDQIWANSKFKICLKVQDRGDSMEMIKRPEAASIKETGRFYLQVGYDEYFDIGQSGWSGADYIPTDRIIKKVDDSLNYINSIGEIEKTISEEKEIEIYTKEKLGDQLTNIVKYIVDISKKQKIKINKLWLSSIPAIIQLNEIIEKYEYRSTPYLINPAIGEYDNPSAQIQGLLTVDLTNIGHLLVYGMAGSGKEHLLTTLIYNTCINHSPDEVNFYIFDYGAETLKIFSKYPQVGSVITADDSDQMLNTLVMIDEEADRRKQLFTEYGGSYKNYIKESGKKLPLIVLIINYYEVFMESNSRMADALSGLIREGSKYGIIFIITTSSNNSLGARVTQLFLNKISMQQPDPQVYRSLLNTPKGLSPKKYFGRGVALYNDNFYEFQTAYIGPKDEVNKLIRETSKKLLEKYKTKAKSALKLPDVVSVDMLSDKVESLKKIPIGYSNVNKEPYFYDFSINSVTPIVSEDISNKGNFITALAKEFSIIQNSNVTLIDAKGLIKNTITNVNIIKNDFNVSLIEMIKGVNSEADGLIRIYIIIGFNEFKNSIDTKYTRYFDSLMSNINKFKKTKLILVDSYNEFKLLELESWFDDLIKKDYSIWLGPNVINQATLNYDNLSPEESKENYEYIGFSCQNGEANAIKYVIEKED